MSQGRQTGPLDPQEARQVFVAVSKTPQFQKLRSTFRNFAFPMTLAALVSYFVFVVLSIFAVDFMKQPFLGMEGLTVGFIIGILQFLVVYVWTAIYVNFMNNKADTAAADIKAFIVKEGAV